MHSIEQTFDFCKCKAHLIAFPLLREDVFFVLFAHTARRCCKSLSTVTVYRRSSRTHPATAHDGFLRVHFARCIVYIFGRKAVRAKEPPTSQTDRHRTNQKPSAMVRQHVSTLSSELGTTGRPYGFRFRFFNVAGGGALTASARS